jgi:hypothetical protein
MLARLRVGVALFASPARAANAFKISLILPVASGHASVGEPAGAAITFCIKQRGDTVAWMTAEVIRDNAARPRQWR